MKVLIIDDQRLFADGVRKLLKSYYPLSTIEHVNNTHFSPENITGFNYPDLILLGINEKATSENFELISKLSHLGFNIPVLVMSATTESAIAGLAIENNASGFVSKSSSRNIIIKAITIVLEGGIYISKPEQCPSSKIQTNNDCTITSRQHEVLCLLSQGLLNKQIAHKLNISSNTVKAHLHDLFTRFDVSNRTAAVQYGYKNGLI